MRVYYDIALKFPVVGVAPKLVLDELARVNALVDINLDTLEIGDTKGYVGGQCDKDDLDDIIAVCEANEAVKIDYGTIWKVVHEEVGE